MILTGQRGFQVRDPQSNLAFTRSRPIKFGSFEWDPKREVDGDCRTCAAAGDLRLKVTGGRERKEFMGQIAGFSHESEHDLALMVSDFLENGSGGSESRYSSDSDSASSDLSHLADRILFLKRTMDQYERDVLSAVRSIILSINETEVHSINGSGLCCRSCIRQLLVKHLKISGYDAAVCSSKWQGFDKVPGGDHEYIDVVRGRERLIIDVDFRSHFEIARAVSSYDSVLTSLPVVYVGSLVKLKQFLQIMVDSAKYSLQQNSMPLPPWRSLAYLQAKWQSKYERKFGIEEIESKNRTTDHSQCTEHLRRLKASLQSEVETERLLKPKTYDKKRTGKSERWSSSSSLMCNS